MDKPILVFITAPSHEAGLQIARALVEQALAACVTLTAPVTSVYRWEGEVQQDSEVLLIAKTRADIFADRLVPAVQALHPYDVPEIIALPITMGLEAYLQWLGESVVKPHA